MRKLHIDNNSENNNDFFIMKCFNKNLNILLFRLDYFLCLFSFSWDKYIRETLHCIVSSFMVKSNYLFFKELLMGKHMTDMTLGDFLASRVRVSLWT